MHTLEQIHMHTRKDTHTDCGQFFVDLHVALPSQPDTQEKKKTGTNAQDALQLLRVDTFPCLPFKHDDRSGVAPLKASQPQRDAFIHPHTEDSELREAMAPTGRRRITMPTVSPPGQGH